MGRQNLRSFFKNLLNKLVTFHLNHKPNILKLGTIDCDMVETTPIVFNDKLFRFEYIRVNYKLNKIGVPHFRFIEVDTSNVTSIFGIVYHFGSAFVDENTVYVFGVNEIGGSVIRVFWSNDLADWRYRDILRLP